MRNTTESTGRAQRTAALIIGASLALACLPAAAVQAEVVNGPPVAVADEATALAGADVRVDVLANDSDPDGDPLALSSVAVTSGDGTAEIDGSGVVVHAGATFVGPLLVDYVVDDGRGGSATGTLTVTVTAPPPVNGPPVPRADAATVVAGGKVTVEVLANDSDPDGDPLALSSALVVSGPGTAVVAGSSVEVRATAAGTIKVDYVVTDGRGGSATGRLTVTSTPAPPVNHRPVARGDSVTVLTGSTTYVRVMANDSDPDGDRISLLSVKPAAHGSATRYGTRVRYRANSSYTGTVRVTYTIRDSHGSRDTAVLTITVKKPAAPSRTQVEAALARLHLPVGPVNGTYDGRTRRALCAWRTVTGRTPDRDLPSRAEARAIVAARSLPRARSTMVVGINVSVTCQAAFWVRPNHQYRRIMPATTGTAAFRTRLGYHRIFSVYRTWKWSTLYPEARMYKPMFFSGGQALHGSSSDTLVRTYPASHGCVRMLHRDIDAMQAASVGYGTVVRVFGHWNG